MTDRLVKLYLRLRARLDAKFLDRQLIGLFGGVHPKNVFNYRYEFFLDRVSPNDIVIDVGCGTGLILSRIAGRIRKGYGIDSDPALFAYVKKWPPADNLEFIQADFLDFDFPSFQRKSGYDVAIFSHVLEHIKDAPAFLRKVNVRRVLVCVPSQENWRTQVLKHLGLNYLSDPGHFREYTRSMLVEELRSAGFAVREIGYNAEGEIVCDAVRNGESNR